MTSSEKPVYLSVQKSELPAISIDDSAQPTSEGSFATQSDSTIGRSRGRSRVTFQQDEEAPDRISPTKSPKVQGFSN